jgi:hypothetical protein
MKFKLCLVALPLVLSACAVPTGPVEVTRYRLSDASPALGRGTIAVVPGPGMDAASTDLQSFEIAVENLLPTLGYTAASPDTSDQIAQVRILRETTPAPISHVGFGASAGSLGSQAGMGIAIPLGASARTATDLVVVIRDRASGKVLWEGRSSLAVTNTSPLAKTALIAPRLAQALFAGFPGNSGETVLVR